MKKSKIFIAFILVLCIILVCGLVACGSTPDTQNNGGNNTENNNNSNNNQNQTPEVCEHTYGEWQHDATNHWKECSKCGEKSENSEHTYGEWQHDTINHWKECSKCGAKSENSEHTYGEWKQDSTEHWKECDICGNEIEKGEHSSKAWQKDSTYHWKNCDECDKEIEKVQHIFNNEYVCTICGYFLNITGTKGLEYEVVNEAQAQAAVVGIGTATAANIVIPEKCVIDGKIYCVTTIGGFYGCSNLTSITIPDSVFCMGYDEAFADCDNLNAVYITDLAAWCNIEFADMWSNPLHYAGNLYVNNELVTDLVIPDSVKTVSDAAFNGGNFKSVTLGNNVTSIGAYAFAFCSELESIDIPNNVTNIDYGAFAYSGLTSFAIPNSITNISDGVFECCYDLQSVTIPNSVTTIGGTVFANCNNLTNIEISNSVTKIGSGAFERCDNLQVNEYDNAYYLGNESNPYLVLYKAKDTNITSCAINSSTKIIYNGAFSGCNGLVQILIPEKLSQIGYGAFSECNNLTSIEIPNSVTDIGGAFEGCDNLQFNEYDNAYYLGNDSNPYLILYKAKDENITSCAINANTKIIYNNAFYRCHSLASITIPEGVISIESNAFMLCSGLTSITIPNSVTTIGFSAFEYCEGLTGVTLGNGVTSIGSWAFGYCDNLKSVYITDTTMLYKIMTLYNYTHLFDNGANLYLNGELLTTLVIPNNITSIHGGLAGCLSLTSVVISDSVTDIDSRTFSDCSGLTNVVIGANVDNIKYRAFENCDNLQEVYYKGTKEEWGNIRVYRENDNLTAATRYYYSETQPTEAGNWWHFDNDGVTPIKW